MFFETSKEGYKAVDLVSDNRISSSVNLLNPLPIHPICGQFELRRLLDASGPPLCKFKSTAIITSEFKFKYCSLTHLLCLNLISTLETLGLPSKIIRVGRAA